ncbi:MAG: CPBP family glutamic-type intramembrane protease [Promethearchaeota archaeon]
MEINRKYLIICVVSLFLILPVFFGLYVENLFLQVSNLYTLLVLFGGLIVLVSLGELMDIFGFNKESLELIKDHDIIKSLISKKNRLGILVLFLMTMIMEELIFRYYLISVLYDTLNLNIFIVLLISSVLFTLYHIHIWFKFRNIRILGTFLCNSFLLGFFLGFIFLTLGFFACVIIHSLLAFLFYLNLFNRNFKVILQQV